MMPTFGLITEGETDQHVLKNILVGYFNDPDLVVRNLQPASDETDASSMTVYGSWTNVFNYCTSNFIDGAFGRNDFLVIQLDTDVSEEKGYDVPKLDNKGKKLTIADLIENIKTRFELLFLETKNNAFFDTYKHRILFAIAVDEIECWLLPLYYTDKIKSTTNNCLFKLNQQLGKKNEKTIPENKIDAVPTYRKISKPYMKNKILLDKYPQNPSFKIFIENELQVKVPIQKEDSDSIT
jgi:hypothetical protein